MSEARWSGIYHVCDQYGVSIQSERTPARAHSACQDLNAHEDLIRARGIQRHFYTYHVEVRKTATEGKLSRA